MADTTLVEAASVSIQAHEELTHLLTTSPGQEQEVVLECRSVMDQLRTIKSKIEGSYFSSSSPHIPTSLNSDCLSKLKLLTLSHTPDTLSEQDKAKMADLVEELLGDHVKRVLCACVLRCPWYAHMITHHHPCGHDDVTRATQHDSKGNILFIIYVAHDDQFFSLSPSHERGLAETTNQGFIFMSEVRHFCSNLLRGTVNFLEVLCAPPECFIICSPPWLQFAGLLNPQVLLGKAFADSCIGHAVGPLTKKRKLKGSLVLSGDVTLTNFCDSFRHLSYLESAIVGEPICSWSTSMPCLERNHGKTAMELLNKGIIAKEELFECVMSWQHDLIEKGLPKISSAGAVWTRQLGQWLADVRLHGSILTTSPTFADKDHQHINQLLSSLNMKDINASDVLAVCEAGSRLYNLSLPTSDTDYIIVFRCPTTSMITSLNSIKEAHDNRGYQLLQEAGAYEARMVCDMLLKGAVNIIELLFAEELYYCTDVWRQLIEKKHLLVSETVVLQYIGYIKVHLKRISSSDKYSGTARERKIFYSIFHKLLSLENFVIHQCPVVKCTGPDRDFIMRIRHGPLEGDLDPAVLHALAQQKLNEAREKLRGRGLRMREHGDYMTLQKWLIHNVRGIK